MFLKEVFFIIEKMIKIYIYIFNSYWTLIEIKNKKIKKKIKYENKKEKNKKKI